MLSQLLTEELREISGSIEVWEGDDRQCIRRIAFEEAYLYECREILFYDYYGLMGGTQKIKVDLHIAEISENYFTVKTPMYIGIGMVLTKETSMN